MPKTRPVGPVLKVEFNTVSRQMEFPASPPSIAPNALAALRRFTRPRPADVEYCDLCAAPLAPHHQHLLEPPARRIVCACDACAILFSGDATMKYRRVPRRIEHWPNFNMTDLQWAGLGVPIALAFFYHSTPQQQMAATYPSPAGPTEAALAGEAWDMLVTENPGLANLEPDVEALLVNRINGARDYYRAPIDECFKLVGLIRTHWRGLSGGAEVWKHVAMFFEELKQRAN